MYFYICAALHNELTIIDLGRFHGEKIKPPNNPSQGLEFLMNCLFVFLVCFPGTGWQSESGITALVLYSGSRAGRVGQGTLWALVPQGADSGEHLKESYLYGVNEIVPLWSRRLGVSGERWQKYVLVIV